MADKPDAKQVDGVTPEDRVQVRSTPFPFIPLERAIDRAASFEAQYKRSPGRIANVLPIWGYTVKSSGGLQTIGALMQFGLFEDEGSGADRKVKLSDLALRILKDERPGKRIEAIKESALKPKVVAERWKVWGAERPPTNECLSELVLDLGFTSDAAARFLKVYDDTVAFAKLVEGDKVADTEVKSDELPADPTLPGNSREQQAAKGVKPASPPGVKKMDAHLQDVFNIDEGQAVIQWPAGMTSDSYTDFVAWLEIVKRKIKRQVEAAAKPAATDVSDLIGRNPDA